MHEQIADYKFNLNYMADEEIKIEEVSEVQPTETTGSETVSPESTIEGTEPTPESGTPSQE